jgi:hypothetical protein
MFSCKFVLYFCGILFFNFAAFYFVILRRSESNMRCDGTRAAKKHCETVGNTMRGAAHRRRQGLRAWFAEGFRNSPKNLSLMPTWCFCHFSNAASAPAAPS